MTTASASGSAREGCYGAWWLNSKGKDGSLVVRVGSAGVCTVVQKQYEVEEHHPFE